MHRTTATTRLQSLCPLLAILPLLLLSASLQTGCASNLAGTSDDKPILYPARLSKEYAATQPRIQFLKTFSTSHDIEPRNTGFDKFLVGEIEGTTQFIVKPYGVAFLPGKILLCDPRSKHIIVLDLESESFRTFGAGLMKRPNGIAVDPETNRIYVSDVGTGNVLIFDANLNYEGRLEPDNAEEESSGEGGGLIKPVGLVVAGDWLYVCDIGDGLIKVFDKKTKAPVMTFGQGDLPEEDLRWPTNIALSPDGRLFVSDTLEARVEIFSQQGKLIEVLGARGRMAGQFVRPKGISIDRAGRVYVVDSAFENVQLFDDQQRLLLFFPEKADEQQGALNMPTGIAVGYDNVQYFEKYVAPGFDLENVIVVTSQFGFNKVNVYGLVIPQPAPGLESEQPEVEPGETPTATP